MPRQIKLTDDQALAHAHAVGAVSLARAEFSRVVVDILSDYDLDPQTPHQIDGNVLTVVEDA